MIQNALCTLCETPLCTQCTSQGFMLNKDSSPTCLFVSTETIKENMKLKTNQENSARYNLDCATIFVWPLHIVVQFFFVIWVVSGVGKYRLHLVGQLTRVQCAHCALHKVLCSTSIHLPHVSFWAPIMLHITGDYGNKWTTPKFVIILAAPITHTKKYRKSPSFKNQEVSLFHIKS